MEIKAAKDEKVLGSGMVHFIFPSIPKDPHDRAIEPPVKGGIWFKRGVEIPEEVVIKLPKAE